jgi:flagellar hook-associated protein 3 FlgL
MAINRVSTYAQHQKLMFNLNSTQGRLADLQNQLASGKKAETFDGLNGRVEFVTSLENKKRAADQYIESNTVILTRLKTMDVAVNNVQDIVSDLRDTIAQARSPYITEDQVFIQQLESMLKNLSNQLNTNIGGRYLFAGTKTDLPPVVDNIQAPESSGTPDDSYYRGDNYDFNARINDHFDMTYGVRANNEAFQNIVASIYKAIEGLQKRDFSELEEAYRISDVALEKVSAIQTTINNNIVTVQDANEEHDTLSGYWKSVASQETDTDMVEVSTQVAIDQAILQASYQAFSRISGLKLADYL